MAQQSRDVDIANMGDPHAVLHLSGPSRPGQAATAKADRVFPDGKPARTDSDAMAASRAYLAEIMTQIRAEFARRFKEERQIFPQCKLPCETCALRVSTDSWIGFEMTVINLVAALADGTPFFCHHAMPIKNGEYRPPTRKVKGKRGKERRVLDERRMQLCAGWATLISMYPESFDVRTVVPEPMVELMCRLAKALPEERDMGEG